MFVEHHDLHHEFPNLHETISALKASNAHFARLFDEYHVLTNKIENLEEADSPVDDFTIEEMKKRRVHLKDELYQMLVASK
ncbi:MAG: hypothetical protein RIR00_1864 [Pseudomonadota bacterium]|jgi:uncharacterized protein YdcH (DUF465 family)